MILMALRKLAFATARFLVSFFAMSLLVHPAMSQDVLRVPQLTDIATFDPDNGFEIGAMSAINNVYEGLVEYQPGTVTIVGRLAKSWRISGDGLEYVFDLVEGVKFHDGSAMTADDVATSFERRRDGGLALSYFLANVAKIEATSPLTLKVVLKRAQPSFLDSLASPWGPKVISPRALARHDASDRASNWLNEHADGTGPYALAEFSRGDRYVLKRNNNYWGRKAFFEEVQIPVIPDISQQLLQLRSGDIDAVPTGYPIAQLPGLPDGLTITSTMSVSLYTLFAKPGSPLEDSEIRDAILTAVNPAIWSQDAFGQYATVAKSIYPNVVMNPNAPIIFPTNIDRAKEIITRKGPVNLVIGLHSAATGYQLVSNLLITQLASIGVKATAYSLPPGAAFNLKDATVQPDLLLTIAGPDAADPENQAKAFFTKNAPVNFFGRYIDEADQLISEAGELAAGSTRNALYERAGQLIFDAGIAIPLVEVQDIVVHTDQIHDLGVRPVYPPGNIDFGSIRR
ncbi:ABC transporter substrate-binding protein [Rhizobium sp. CG4]|nr:ABC transporter substrate-binding protein [Rhizobium sp. CG4]